MGVPRGPPGGCAPAENLLPHGQARGRGCGLPRLLGCKLCWERACCLRRQLNLKPSLPLPLPLPPPTQGLTSLTLVDVYPSWLDGLQQLQQLRRVSLAGGWAEAAEAALRLLPALPVLTSLTLQPEAWVPAQSWHHLGSLTALQDLTVRQHRDGAAQYAALAAPLHAVAPRLRSLAVVAGDAAVLQQPLAACVQVARLDICVSLTGRRGDDAAALAVLTALPLLQHLRLETWGLGSEAVPAALVRASGDRGSWSGGGVMPDCWCGPAPAVCWSTVAVLRIYALTQCQLLPACLPGAPVPCLQGQLDGLTHLEVAGHFFSGSWEALRHLRHLRELSVQDVACWRRLRASLPVLGTVTSLTVGGGGAKLSERIWQELSRATQLRALALHRFAVRPLSAVARSFEHLTRLSIRGVGYESEGESPALTDDHPSLAGFIQAATQGSYYAYNRRVVASLRHLPPRLLDLELSACLLHSVPPSLSALPLTRLVLSYNTFDGDPLRALRPLRPTLAELSLRHCWLYVEPAVLRHLTGCSHLDLSANPIARGFWHRYKLDSTGDWAFEGWGPPEVYRRTARLCLYLLGIPLFALSMQHGILVAARNALARFCCLCLACRWPRSDIACLVVAAFAAALPFWFILLIPGVDRS